MAKKYRKVQIWDKWLPVNRLSNFQLFKYSQTKETEVFTEEGSTSKKIPAEVLIQMAQLVIRRGMVKSI